jgi:hypothetical protein
MKRFKVQIGPRKDQPRLSFEAMAASAGECFEQHSDLAEVGERVEIECMSLMGDERNHREESRCIERSDLARECDQRAEFRGGTR